MSTVVTTELSINEVLKEMKDSYEEKITDPNENPGDYIKSQNLIKKLHTYIAREFIENGIDERRVKEEVKLYGYIKYKDQDICIIPEKYSSEEIDITWGEEKYLGKKCESNDITEKIISINIRSQLSSLMKNKDTLLERTFAEALNFHLRCPKMCLGEVYLIPVYEYNNKKFEENKVEFIKPSVYNPIMFKDIPNNNLTRDIILELDILEDRIKKLYLEEKEILEKYGKYIFKLTDKYIEENPDKDDVIKYNKYEDVRCKLINYSKKLNVSINNVLKISRYGLDKFRSIQKSQIIDLELIKKDNDKFIEKLLSIDEFEDIKDIYLKKQEIIKKYGNKKLNLGKNSSVEKINDFDKVKELDSTLKFKLKIVKNDLSKYMKLSEDEIDILKEIDTETLIDLGKVKYWNRKTTITELYDKFRELNIFNTFVNMYETEKKILFEYGRLDFKLNKKYVEGNPDNEDVLKYNQYKKIKSELEPIKEDISRIIVIRQRLERYINFFDEINKRDNINKDFHKYERCTLLIVDFSEIEPKIYNSTEDLKEHGLVSPDFNTELANMKIDDFASDIINIYNGRFNQE